MKLKGKKIAVLMTDGFEESEFTSPKEAIEKEGATVEIVSLKDGEVKSWTKGNWGKSFKVTHSIDNAKSSDYDALLIPGGVINPDQIRNNESAITFVKDFFNDNSQRPVAAICHGPQVLISAGVVRDRKMTSYSSVRIDLENAGANWQDKAVVVDQGLVTSRNPDDLDKFNEKVIEEFAEGKHESPRIHG